MTPLKQMIQIALGSLAGANLPDEGLPSPSLLAQNLSKDLVGAIALKNPLNQGLPDLLATHGSHSSHSSHSSHYSSSGGGSYYPPSAPSPPPAPRAAPTPDYIVPSTAPAPKPAPKKPKGDSLKMIIMRVQAALFSQGYDPGAIDGVLSESTKSALIEYQTKNGLQVTGTLTTETLTALNVPLQ